MVRTLLVAAAATTFAFAFAPSAALACDGNGDCPGKHAKKEGAEAVKGEVKAATVKADGKKVQPAQQKDSAVKPVQQTSIMDQVDQILAAKCPCSSQADCTCKKGECKCSKCGGHKKNVRMIESLRETEDGTDLPATARYDATAGIFI